MIPEKFVFQIIGSIGRVSSRAAVVPGSLGQYLELAMLGTPIPDETWAAFGLRVYVEEDTDMGDDPTPPA